MDFDFRMTRWPNTTASRMQIAAVLFQLVGRYARRNGRDAALGRLIRWWRVHVTKLAEAGLPRIRGKKLQYARNCRPAFGAVVPNDARPCSLTRVCPFCWARTAESVFRRTVRTADAIRMLVGPFDLLEWQLSYQLNLASEPFPEVAFDIRLRHASNAAQMLSTLGGHLITTVEPAGSLSSDNEFPQVSYRFFTLLEPGASISEDWPGRGRCWPNPTEEELAGVVGRTHRYPVGLMRGSAESVVGILEAIGRTRLTRSYGAMLNGRVPDLDKLAERRERLRNACIPLRLCAF